MLADAVTARISGMLVASLVVTDIVVMRTVMPACIRMVVIGTGKEEMVMVGVRDVDTEIPMVATGVDRPVEIVGTYEAAILAAAQHPTEIVVAYIQIVIITVERPFISPQHIVHHIAHGGNEVIIDFIDIVVLLVTQIQLVCHLIGKETGLLTYSAIAHSFCAGIA